MDHATWKAKVAALKAEIRAYNAEGARAQVKGHAIVAKAAYAGAAEANKELIALQKREPKR